MEQAFLAEYETEGIKARSSCRHLPKKEKLAMYLYRVHITNRAFVATNDYSLGSEVTVSSIDRWSELGFRSVPGCNSANRIRYRS